MFPADHAPPHFHVKGADWAVAIEIQSLAVVASRGKPPSAALAHVLAWAQQNQALLLATWDELNEPAR
jgi:hypothetical protein